MRVVAGRRGLVRRGDESASVGLGGAFPRRDESTGRQITTGRTEAPPLARLFYFEKASLSTQLPSNASLTLR